MSKPIDFKIYVDKTSEQIREDGAIATDPGPRDILRALKNLNSEGNCKYIY